MSKICRPTLKQQGFRFLSLTPELRSMVYRECVKDDIVCKCSRCSHSIDERPGSFDQLSNKIHCPIQQYLALLGTSRQIRSEAISLFDNHGQTLPNVSVLHKFLYALGAQRRAQLETLSFILTAAYSIWTAIAAAKDWESTASARYSFTLLANECHALRSLTVYVDDDICEECLQGIAVSKHEPSAKWRHSRTSFIVGLELYYLANVKGVESVEFRPRHVEKPFSQKLSSSLRKRAETMMRPTTQHGPIRMLSEVDNDANIEAQIGSSRFNIQTRWLADC